MVKCLDCSNEAINNWRVCQSCMDASINECIAVETKALEACEKRLSLVSDPRERKSVKDSINRHILEISYLKKEIPRPAKPSKKDSFK